MSEDFAMAAIAACMDRMPRDFFGMEDYEEFHDDMQAYLMK
jgi:hypothetical protein